jgi:prepilin-type N-terminal cleavage/methylation domain-containing protein
MQTKLDRKGFSIVEVLIAIVIIAAVVLCGWLAWHHAHHKKEPTPSPAASASNSQKSNSSSQANSPTGSTQSYMAIPEWGIKMPLASAISDVYYIASNSSEDANGQPNTIWLGLKSITTNDCVPTASNADNTEIAAILRVSPTDADPVSGTPYTTLYPNGTTVNGYYYALDDERTLESNCASQQTLQSIDTALKTAVSGIIAQ